MHGHFRQQGQGVGAALMTHAIAAARKLGHRAIMLVGDAPYFGRFGFVPAAEVRLAGPVDPRRLLWLPLDVDSVSGLATAA